MLDHLVPPPEGLVFPENAEAALIRCADGVVLRAAFMRSGASTEKMNAGLPSGNAARGKPPTKATRSSAGKAVGKVAGSRMAAPANDSAPPAEIAPARGTVFLLQGRSEFIEKYGEVAAELLARGFSVATLDWRGQGGSARQLRDPRKGHVEDFSDYLLDLEALIAAADLRGMPEPYGMLAHSTGGAIALTALEQGVTRFRRIVTTSPLVGIAGLSAPRGARLLTRFLASIGLSGFYLPTGGAASHVEKSFDGNVLTSDPARFAASGRWIAAEPGLAIGDPTIGWLDATFDALATFAEEGFCAENSTPVLMILAGDDQVVDSAAAEALAQRMRGASALTLRGSRHEILIERDEIRTEFWAAFDAFMQLDVEPALSELADTKNEMATIAPSAAAG
jgi:lysophospholipase